MNMQRIFRGALIPTLITAVGGSAWQFAAIEQNRLVLGDLQSSIANDRKLLRQLVGHRGPQETKAEAVTPAAAPDGMGAEVSPTINETIYALLHQVEDMKAWFQANPTHQIPEMRYLDEHDWIKETASADPSTAEGARRIAANLRGVATGRFTGQVLKEALSRYVTEHAGMLPLTVSELGPLLTNPEDRPILDRYEMLVTGLATTAAAQNLALAIKPASIVDPAYDRSVRTGPGSSFIIRGAPLIDLAYSRAQAAYANAHSGDLISDIDTLLPYFSDPADARKYIEQRKKWEAESAARQVAAERTK